MESKAEAEVSSSLSSVPHLRPHADKASTFRHSEWDMYFPIELITNIIARLPVKTLSRFRCVSTTWQDVIESEYFETMHLDLFGKLQKNTCFLTLIFPQNKWSKVRWFFANAYTFKTISDIPWLTHCSYIDGSVNGLVLLDPTLPYRDGPLFLWNPSIKHHFIIPRNPTFGLSHARVVLGYNASKNDYKVVAMHCRKVVVESNKFPTLVMVYSLRNRCWRSLSCSLPTMRILSKNMHLRGQIYWIASPDKNETYRSDQSWRCVSFDVCKEVFNFIVLPSTKRDDDALSTDLFVLGESISLVDTYEKEIWIWVMGMKHNSRCWIKRSKVDLLEPYSEIYVPNFLRFLRRDGELIHGLVLPKKLDEREIVSYNINTGKRSKIIQKADKIHYEYVESLVLLRKEKGTQVSPKQPSQKQDDEDGKVAWDAG